MGRIHHTNPCAVNTETTRFFMLFADVAWRLAVDGKKAAHNDKTRTHLSGQRQVQYLAKFSRSRLVSSGGENHLVDLVNEVAEMERLGQDLGILGSL